MFSHVHRLVRELRETLGFDPASLSGEQAIELLEAFTQVERLGAAGRTLVSARVEASKLWQRDGHRTFASWLAARAGVPVGEAISAAQTAQRLAQLPATRRAMCDGELSEAQVREVASAASADGDAESRMLDLARTQTLRTLRRQGARVRAAAAPDETARYRAIHEGRYLRSWTDEDGALRLDGRLTPDAGASVLAAIEVRKGALVRQARRQGRHEPYQAHAADALVALARDASPQGSEASGDGPQAMVHVLVDHAALVRGAARAGETCEIPGVGPIPVATARSLSADSILKVLVTDGVDIRTVAGAGRAIRADLRTALEVRDPECVVPGCDERDRLEHDHWRVPYRDGGPTDIDDLARVCPWHHYLKTYCGFLLRGGPGAWEWLSPDERQGLDAAGARPPPVEVA